jgi:CheY-like chemotaxis protein
VNDFKPTVVIADDDPEMLAVVAKLLNSKFTVVGRAGDGFAALRAIKEFRPQLAILDISMPKINGLDVANSSTRPKA